MTSRPRRGGSVARRAGLACGAALAIACAGGCARDTSSSGDSPSPPPAAVAASAVPADHLGPDELVEGKEQAFGVVLPRGLQVDERFVDTIHASGPLSIRSLVRYFRPRLVGGFLREGERSATFDGVTAPGSPPDSLLTVHFEVQPGRTRVEISATKQHPVAVMPDDDSRWKAEGLSPNGRILDPMHMH